MLNFGEKLLLQLLNSAICDEFSNILCFLLTFKYQAISQKAPIRCFCFLIDFVVGTPIKRAEKISQTGPDKNEKKIQGRGVLGLEHLISLYIINVFFLHTFQHPSPNFFFHLCRDPSETFTPPFLLGFQQQHLRKSKKI